MYGARARSDRADARVRTGGRFTPPLLLAAFVVATAAAVGADLRLPDAAKRQDWPQVRSLLSQRVDPNVRAADGSTALLWAAHWNDPDIAGLLLRAGAD